VFRSSDDTAETGTENAVEGDAQKLPQTSDGAMETGREIALDGDAGDKVVTTSDEVGSVADEVGSVAERKESEGNTLSSVVERTKGELETAIGNHGNGGCEPPVDVSVEMDNLANSNDVSASENNVVLNNAENQEVRTLENDAAPINNVENNVENVAADTNVSGITNVTKDKINLESLPESEASNRSLGWTNVEYTGAAPQAKRLKISEPEINQVAPQLSSRSDISKSVKFSAEIYVSQELDERISESAAKPCQNGSGDSSGIQDTAAVGMATSYAEKDARDIGSVLGMSSAECDTGRSATAGVETTKNTVMELEGARKEVTEIEKKARNISEAMEKYNLVIKDYNLVSFLSTP
jgi:hypothetical protein